ncbi:MAG: hypothetical protein JWM86_1364 [Thermoleophilia bacterium]|nr:hypothetical protein [Thermoleophilia bacterium]
MPTRRTILVLLAGAALSLAPLVGAAVAHPTPMDWRHLRFEREVRWNELRRVEALAGREGEIRARDEAWRHGRNEVEFLAQYERLRTQATAYGAAGGPVDACLRDAARDVALASAQARANALGQPVDVIVC